MLIKKITALIIFVSLATTAYAANETIQTKLQTKGLLFGCSSASLINKSGIEGPTKIIVSKKPIDIGFKYYCVTGQEIPTPKNLPCSRYIKSKTIFEIITLKQLNSPSDRCLLNP